MAINLTKGGDKHSIDLTKHISLTLHANLNWVQVKRTGMFSFLNSRQEADLDLGCMFEMLDGSKGVIQPLGNYFGSATSMPYIQLDKDDRTGVSDDGENMHIIRPELIKRVLFFAMIYAGAADFSKVQASMFFRISDGQEVSLSLDNVASNKLFCAAALITNNSGHVTIQKEALYFYGHQQADQHYGFGFNWQPGSKD